MGHMVTSADIPVDGEKIDGNKLQRIRTICGGIMVGGIAISFPILIAGMFVSDKAQGSYAYSWLYAFFFFTTDVG